MSKLDGLKEELAYLKLWLGIIDHCRNQFDRLATDELPVRLLVIVAERLRGARLNWRGMFLGFIVKLSVR